MNERKISKLFEAARKEQPPAPSGDFESSVLRAVHSSRNPIRADEPPLLEALGALLPRLAMATALLIVVCFVVDRGLSSFGGPDLSDGITVISEQWLFAAN